jgi:hypothetical protein
MGFEEEGGVFGSEQEDVGGLLVEGGLAFPLEEKMVAGAVERALDEG